MDRSFDVAVTGVILGPIGLAVGSAVVDGGIWAALLAIALLVFSVGAAIRYRQNRDDEKRRERARLEYEAREQEREKAHFFTDVERYFPWVAPALRERLESGEALEDAFWQSLAEAPATELGTTFYGLPALLPLSERSKHLYIVGKTGSGKTSLLLHLIREDLEAGRGVAVVAPEAELFRDWLLPIIPPERADDVIYFAPGQSDNTITLNPLAVEPNRDAKRAAGELATILRRAFGEEDFGARATPIVANALACLASLPHATLWDFKRLLIDTTFRARVLASVDDPYVREFWLSTYPSYPKGSHLPILNRLDQFLRPVAIRQAFCHPVSSFSIRRVIESQGILFLDLSRLDPDAMTLLGQLFLSAFQLELMRREEIPEDERLPFHLYADEFQSFAGAAEGTWRELLSRGRRYGLALTLAHQHPSQLSTELQEEILGNVGSICAFGLSAKDAYALRREFLEEDPSDFSVRPIAQETIVGLKVGQAIARLSGGALAVPLDALPPLDRPNQAAGAAVRARSWESHGIPLSERTAHEPTLPVEEAVAEKRTRAAPDLCSGDGVVLGTNVHGGKATQVALDERQRTQHLYVIGSSGTGKSTFLLNCIVQGMERGEGLAVLDPHGDLIDEILARVPKDRDDDVVLVDPADRDWPVGFNVLRAHSDVEKELLASDLVDVFRRLSTRWGDQMNSILANAILAFLESDQGGTLLDLRRFLVEPEFREAFLATVRDPDVVYYWQREFPMLPGKPQAPLLTRLDTFLRPKLIRNMVSQKESRLDFGAIMDRGGIFLARLSQGAIGEGNAYLLGSLLVSKFYQLAIARQAIGEAERRPFFLYVDECHNFLTPSMASILAGARKYRLGLILAHQELQQVSGRDTDVLSAVIANPYTRVCFRLGDLDAKRLEKGFAHFSAEDLQSLGVGEAICRVERADYDFNIKTQPLPAVDPATARNRQTHLLALSRERYATNRDTVEGERYVPQPPLEAPPAPAPAVPQRKLQPVIPPSSPPRDAPQHAITAPAPVVVPVPAPPTPGRGGQRHKYLQSLIKRWGESHGYRATIEKQILDGAASIDVALEGRDQSIAVEIRITSSPNHEVDHIRACLSAGFNHVISLSDSTRGAAQLQALLETALNEGEQRRVQCLTPDSMFTFLGQLAASSAASESTVRGYKVSVQYSPTGEDEAQHKKRAISDVVAAALKRMKD